MLGFHALLRFGAIALGLATIGLPLAATAQDVPSYARPAYAGTDETIHGRIRSVDGAFNITVADDRGFLDSVQLHQGTIINPTGLTLSEGMSVTILGANSGSTFSANEIDTPYSYSGPLPTPVYYGPGYWCPGFGYGYGPSFSLAIVIGGGYRPWYYEHRSFYGRPWDGHGYFGGYVGGGPEGRGRMEERHPFNDPAVRAPSGAHSANPRVPPAFAGRSFAGESRVNAESGGNVESRVYGGPRVHDGAHATTEQFSTESNRAEPSLQNRGAGAAGNYPHGTTVPRESSPSTGYGGGRSVGGAPHASAPHGGGGHPH